MAIERHLILQELALRPSGEWAPAAPGWTVVRVVEGVGYWFHSGGAGELKPGDGFVATALSNLVLRASQLGPLKLEFYTVQPQFLNGLLTVAEGHQLQGTASGPAAQAIAFKADDAVGKKFLHLVAQPQREGLAMRSALLQLWSQAVAGVLHLPPVADHGLKLRERFRQMVAQMPDAELATRPLPELAEQLHCSERHFSRLFRDEFGVSLRSRQTELRLLRAQQLLADGSAKIINVAYESGYRHLGLFNAMFKRRFGVTPSEWRQRHFSVRPKTCLKRPGAALVALLLLLEFFLVPSLRAQTAGTPGAPLAPAAASKQTAGTNAGPVFTVQKYLVSGNSILQPKEIGNALTNSPDAFGTNVTIGDIREALGGLQLAYRERGFVTVSVGLPPQKLTNATVKVKVTEGRLAAIRVTGNDWFSTANVLRALPSLHTNLLLNSHVFQRELDAANANRDRQIYPVIGPGPEPGTSELTLKVKDTLPLHARIEINDDSTPSTPQSRLAFNAQYDNLWQLEHQVGINYTFSELDYKNHGNYYATPLDDPQVATYGAYYRMPLGRPEAVQQEVDDSRGSFGYSEVTHTFNLPPPTGRPELTVYGSRSTEDTGVQWGPYKNVTGTNGSGLLQIGSQDSGENLSLNDGVGGKLSLPLPKLEKISSTLILGFDYKDYQNTSYNTNNFFATSYITNSDSTVSNITSTVASGQPNQYTAVAYYPLNVGLTASRPDEWGSTAFNAQMNYNPATGWGSLPDLAYSAGVQPIVSSNSQTHVVTTNTPANRARNNYFTVQSGMTRDQRIYKDWDALIHADGQWASCPLFSNEQYAMGGTSGVRGYQNGEVYGDCGWRVSFEPRTPMVNIGMVDGSQPFWVRASVFMDYGETYLLQQVSPGSSTNEKFWGYGASLIGNVGNHIDGRLTVAFPLISSALTQAETVQVYFAVGAQF